jgi:hypothetical protein
MCLSTYDNIHKGAAAMLNPTSSMRQLHTDVEQIRLPKSPVPDALESAHNDALTLCSAASCALQSAFYIQKFSSARLLTDQ